MLENVPGIVPVHRRHLRLQARGRGPDAHVRRRGRRVPHQPALQAGVAKACRPSGCRPPSTRSRCTATTPTCGPTSTARSATRGVSIATLDDMKVLYSGFDLCSPSTSVSMTINGPAPTILAMFMNTAIDQQLDKFAADNGREPTDDEAQKIREWALANVRGTVQADILKEDQGQNTCIFSTEFSPEGDGRHRRVLRAPRRAQLLLGQSISRLPHRRGRRQPDQPARLHALATASPSSRPIWRAACTSTTSRRTCRFFFSNGMDPEYTRARPRGAAHLGGGDARPLRRQRAQPEAEVPRADQRAARCTRRRSPSTTSAPRCRR